MFFLENCHLAILKFEGVCENKARQISRPRKEVLATHICFLWPQAYTQ